ncbi:MAG: response regulator [Dehalococcoidia bacterium]|nr:response regulator [Dehalococcoidia bacterium]
MNRKRILLVEDDPLSLKLMRDALAAGGYETQETSSGLEVPALAREYRPDLVLMDIGLPGMDGVEATRQLKQSAESGHVPVVAVTAYAMPADEARARAAGCDAYLTKPLRLSELLSVVGGLLGDGAYAPAADSEQGTEK